MRTVLTYLQATYAVKRSFRANNWLVLFAALVGATVQYYIWSSLGDKGSETTLTSYGLFAILFNLVVPMKMVADSLSKMINEGNIATVLSKPIKLSYLLLGTAFGDTLYSVIYKVVPLAVIYFILFGSRLILDLHRLMLAIPSIILAWMISWLTGALIGMTAVYTVRTSGLMALISGLLVVFGGMVIPINVYPDWLAAIARWSPFYSMMYSPLSILTGLNDHSVPVVLMTQGAWLIILFGFNEWVSKVSSERLSIAGG